MSANRVGMATARARILFELHDKLRHIGPARLVRPRSPQARTGRLTKGWCKLRRHRTRRCSNGLLRPHPGIAAARRLRQVRLAFPPDGALSRLCAGGTAALLRRPRLKKRRRKRSTRPRGGRRHDAPTVSVIIPAYLRRPHHRPGRGQRPGADQSRQAEIVIVDDGSPDDLARRAEPLRRARASDPQSQRRRRQRPQPRHRPGDRRTDRVPRRRRLLGAAEAGNRQLGRAAKTPRSRPDVEPLLRWQTRRPAARSRRTARRRTCSTRCSGRPARRALAVVARIWTSTVLVRRERAGAHRFDEQAENGGRRGPVDSPGAGRAGVSVVGATGDGGAGDGIAVALRRGGRLPEHAARRPPQRGLARPGGRAGLGTEALPRLGGGAPRPRRSAGRAAAGVAALGRQPWSPQGLVDSVFKSRGAVPCQTTK